MNNNTIPNQYNFYVYDTLIVPELDKINWIFHVEAEQQKYPINYRLVILHVFWRHCINNALKPSYNADLLKGVEKYIKEDLQGMSDQPIMIDFNSVRSYTNGFLKIFPLILNDNFGDKSLGFA